MPRQLRSVDVGKLVVVLVDVWRRHATAHANGDDAGGGQWHGVSDRSVGERDVQRAGVSSQLRGVDVGKLVDVHSIVWWRHTTTNAHGDDGGSGRRHGVSDGSDGERDVQRAGVCVARPNVQCVHVVRRLRGQREDGATRVSVLRADRRCSRRVPIQVFGGWQFDEWHDGVSDGL